MTPRPPPAQVGRGLGPGSSSGGGAARGPDASVLGVVLAGGDSRRFGADKALAPLAGVPLARRAASVLETAGLPVAVVGRVPGGSLEGMVVLSDRRPGFGPVGGIETALHEAAAQGRAGAFVLGCDLPLVPPDLVSLLVSRFDGKRPVVPASSGPRGFEPLCACYPVSLLASVRSLLDGGGGAAADLLTGSGVDLVPVSAWRRVADPATCFLNVNTPEERQRAEDLLASAARFGGSDGGAA